MEKRVLLLDSHNGIYIPQMFCENFSHEIVNKKDLKYDIQACASGPEEAEEYWEAWENILNNAELSSGYVLDHNTDLFKVKKDG